VDFDPLTEVAEREHPTPGRMALYESAFMPKRGRFSWSTMNIGLQRFDLAVHDNIQLGISAVLPIGVLAVMPEVKVGGEVAEDLHLAVTARFGTLLMPMVGLVLGYGGSAMATYGTPNLHLTAGVHAYGFTAPINGDGHLWVVHPTLGGVARLANYAVLHMDVGPVLSPALSNRNTCFDGACPAEPTVRGDMWAIKYGVRFHGDHFFGDVSFVIPTDEDWLKVAPYLPLGLPALTLGYAF
jgi:hypothetical protein